MQAARGWSMARSLAAAMRRHTPAYCTAAQSPSPSSSSSERIAVYTRGGDGGSSVLFNGERLSKSSEVFHALGDVDEANSQVGAAASLLPRSSPLLPVLQEVQSRLLDVGAALATPSSSSSSSRMARVAFEAEHTTDLEAQIDAMDAQLEPLRNFLLPGGSPAAASLHVARSVTRRAERRVAAVPDLPANVLPYVNRLSDFLFVAARLVAKEDGTGEISYCKAKEPSERRKRRSERREQLAVQADT